MLFSGVGNSVGKRGFNAPSDIGSVKKGLSLSGDWNPMVEMYDHPTSGPAKTFETGLEGLQDRFGLKKDGIMKPGGPTELALKSETARNSVDQFSRKVPSLVGLSDGVGFGQKNKPNDVKSMTTLLGGMGAPSLSAPKAPTPPKLDQAPKAGLGHVVNKGPGGDLTSGGLFQTVPQTPSVMDMDPNAQVHKEPYLPSSDLDPGNVIQKLPYRPPSPNGALSDAIKWFQTQFGLEPDGVMRPDGPSIGLLDRLLSPILGAGVLDPSLVGGPSPAKPKQPVFGPWGVEYPDGHFDGDGMFVPDDQGYEPEIWFDDYGSPKKVSFQEYAHHHQGKPPLWHENAKGLIEMNGEFKSEVVPRVAAYGVSRDPETGEMYEIDFASTQENIEDTNQKTAETNSIPTKEDNLDVGTSDPAGDEEKRIPVLYDNKERRASILEGTESTFFIEDNPDADGSEPLYALNSQSEVSDYEDLIEQEANNAGIDPNLVKAVVHLETTHGYYDKALEFFSIDPSTLRPMNVNVDYWEGLGYSREDLSDPQKNIEAGVRIISGIIERLDTYDVRQIGTLYQNLAAEKVSDYGARIEQLIKEKPWEAD